MAFLETLDPVTLINLILSITIVVVAVWGYSRLKNITPLYIGAAYVLFSTSHAILLFKVTEVPQSLLIAIRLCGYLLVIFGLYAILKLVMELQQAQERIESRKGGTIAPDCLPCVATNCGFLVIALSLMGLALQAYIFLSSTNMPDFLIITGQPLIPGPIVLALFLLLGICLATLQLWKDEHWPQTLITIIAGIVLILSVLFIISALMGNIQDGKIVLPGGIVGTSAIVIRSFLTVTGLGIAAVILLTLRSPQPPMRDAGAVLSALLFFIGAFTLVGYAYQSPYLYGGSLQPVTPSSAVMFMILGAGLLAYIGTGSRLITRALDNSIQSEMMRGLIPVMVIAVLIEGWICLVALPAIGKVINPAFVSAGVVIISIIAISFVIAIQAGQISAVIMRAEQEREKAEDQKQKSQALFKTMFESSADGILTLDNDRILDCNKTAEVMFGYPRDQINGKSLLTFSPERQPDGQLSSEKVQEIVAAALAGETMFYEWDHLRKNGASFPTEISLNRVKCGKKFYLQASIRDITLRKMDEEELREAYGRITAAEEELRQQYTALAEKEAHLQREEDKFHTMADFTVDWEFWLAPDNTFVYISPSCEEITGFSVAEFMQDPSLMGTIVHKDDLPLFTHHKETIHGTAHHGHDEFRIVRKDGDIRWIAHSCRPVYGKDGTYLGRRATNRDITERKKAEEALRESEGRVRRKLAAILEEEGDIGLLNLSDIIDIPALQALMDDIHRLTGIASAVIETNGTVLIGAGWQDICTQFHRQNPESCRNCIESDTALTTGVGQGEFKLYKCKNNMWDIATPLLVGGKHLGNIFVGQFMLADEIQDREVFRRQAEQYGFDETAYLAAFDRVPRVSRETVSAVMAFYTRFAGLITNLSMSNITLARTGAERERLMTSLQASEEELRHQYTALAEAEEMFRNPVEHSPVGVYLQQDNIIRYANPRFAEMLGYTRDEVLNKPFEELADPDHHSRVCVMGSPQQEGEADSHSRCAEFTGRKKDGTPIELEIFEAPMEYKGHPAFYGTLVDITERKKADAAMRESEEKTRLILDSAAEAIYGVDETGRCVFYNPSCARLTGYTRPGEMLGKNMHMLLHHSHPDGTPMPSAQCRIFLGYLKGEGSHFDDEVFWRADGSSFPVEVWSYPQKKDGNITGMVVTFFDITERKKAEAALLEDEQKLQQQNLELEASNEEVRSIAQTLQDNLDELLKSQKALQESEDKLRLQNMDLEASNEEIRAISETLQNNYNELAKSQKALAENEEKYRSLVDNLSVAVYRNDLESPSRWIWVNPAFCKILGYDSIEEAMSHPVSDIYFSPEDRLPIIHALNKVGSIKNFEVVFKKKNGSPIWVSLSAQVKKNPDGSIAWVDGIGEDITERKRAEMAIRESEERVRSILESAAEAIYGIDKEGNCTFYNPSCARLTGYTKPDELLGKNMHTLIHHSNPDGTAMPRESCRVALAMIEGKSIHLDDEVFWKADGTSFPVEVWAYPQVKEGAVTGMVVTFFDITERKKMENDIRTNLGEKEMLLKEIHHRVKNNMQVISGLLLVQSQTIKDESVKALFNEAMTRIKSIALVHEQLYRSDNLSQIEYGGYLRKMFGPLFESYKADARKIAMVIESDNVYVTIEKAVPCSLIVNEMMSNSLKYAFPGDKKGEIRIRFSLDESKENYILDYSDNGIGLPPGFVPGKTGSLGTTLINGLTKQLKGTLAMVPEAQGVHYLITFPARELRGK